MDIVLAIIGATMITDFIFDSDSSTQVDELDWSWKKRLLTIFL